MMEMKMDEISKSSEKRALLPSSSSSSSSDTEANKQKLPPRKLCMIWALPGSSVLCLFIVDLNSSEFKNDDDGDDDDDDGGGGGCGLIIIPLSPSLVLSIGDRLNTTFCVIDSTLYMFDCASKNVFTIDLEGSSHSTQLNTSLLTVMEHTKTTPSAFPTPDGKKILLFSTWFDARKKNDDVDFELYDLSSNSWQKLPDLLDDRDKYFYITSFNFVDESTFFVATSAGMFALDLNALDKGWCARDSFFGAPYIPLKGSAFSVIGDEMCLTPCQAFDIKTRIRSGGWYPLPLPTSSVMTHFIGGGVAVLDHNGAEDGGGGGGYTFCTVRSGARAEGQDYFVVMTVYKWDLVKYRADKLVWPHPLRPAPPCIDIVKSFKLTLKDKHVDDDLVVPLYLFPF